MTTTTADPRIVLTLDAGGTNFVFSAIQGGQEIVQPLQRPANGHHLSQCLDGMIEGFTAVRRQLSLPATAISFAFPGPADYPQGIIGDLLNLPGFRGGIPLGSILKNKLGLPTFINNDGDLYAYGEALAGFLPEVNAQLQQAGNTKQYHNLVGLTLGTGFGCGIVHNQRLVVGDNAMAGEVWIVSNRRSPDVNSEEYISARAIVRWYQQHARDNANQVHEPKQVFEIARGTMAGDQEAARNAFDHLGQCLGDVIANLIALTDGLIVIGGGLAGASQFFMPAVMRECQSRYPQLKGGDIPRLVQKVYNLDDPQQRDHFLHSDATMVEVPDSGEKLFYQPHPKIGIGTTRMSTNRAVALGAYSFALQQLDQST